MVFAAIGLTCNPCKTGSCSCIVSECLSGSAVTYTTSDCSGEPAYENIFTLYSFTWSPQNSGNHYSRVLCDDKTLSTCLTITVSADTITSTTTWTTTASTIITTTEPECEYDSDCNEGFECIDGECVLKSETTTTIPAPGPDYTWYIVLGIILILVIIYMVYFLFMKKKPKTAYEALYRKWSR